MDILARYDEMMSIRLLIALSNQSFRAQPREPISIKLMELQQHMPKSNSIIILTASNFLYIIIIILLIIA